MLRLFWLAALGVVLAALLVFGLPALAAPVTTAAALAPSAGGASAGTG